MITPPDRSRPFVALALVCALACAPADRDHGSVDEPAVSAEPGPVVVIGGRLEPDNRALFVAMLDLRLADAPVCVIPTASAEPEDSMQAYLGDFVRYGGPTAAIGVALVDGDHAAAADPATADRLRGCGGFFFTGGDQSRIVDTFKPGGRATLAYAALVARHQQGAFVAGTSAGAAMISDPMIGGGDSDAALREGVCAGDGCDGVWVRDGMGLWPGWLTDQHFLVRGRAGRLLAALVGVEQGPRLGLGVDEDTGVIVHGGVAEVVGRSGAVVIDARAARVDARGWTGVDLRLYGPGDRFDPRDGRPLSPLPPAREPTGADAAAVDAPAVAFEGWAFTALLLALADPAQPEDARATVEGEGWSLTVARGPEFRAGAAVGPEGLGFAGPFAVELERPSPEAAPAPSSALPSPEP